MARPYDGDGQGMRRAVTGSLVLHAFILATLLIAGWSGQKRIMQDPVFVDLVSTVRQGPAPVAGPLPVAAAPDARPDKAEETKKADRKTEAVHSAQKTTVKIPVKPVSKAEQKDAKRPAEAIKARDAVQKEMEAASVEEALKRVSEKVRKKDDAAEVESRIEEMRRKSEAEKGALAKEVSEVKKGLARRSPAADSIVRRDDGSDRSAAIEARYPAYYSLIRDRVQAAWIYPEGFNANDVSIVISIKIGKSGRLIDSWVEKGSGNRSFDESLINAVRKASPFPPLPQDFNSVYLETGLRFCPLCKE